MEKRSPAVGACQDGQWVMALALLNQMSVFRVELGFITCAAVLTACSVAQQWLRCFQVLEQMRDLHLAIDFVALCDTVQACDRCGLGQTAVPPLLTEVRTSLLDYATAFRDQSRVASCVLEPA
ncbi:bioF [Symbiodinium natans]|uniref:BioF protein n=1 Tax=Symbiodinium natans TaxID=878477 RepID=A0A812MEZ4_9DINO|nr:bioF [Symbiodinium natans]